jgi:hypothetical protein
MARRPAKRTCESCLDIDAREWQRAGLLRYGKDFSCSWSRLGKTFATIGVAPRGDVVVLRFDTCGAAQEQPVPLAWTRCTFGWRPWFRCGCGRRRAKLFLRCGDAAFACRACNGLAYVSQSRPADAAITRARYLRMRLGGSGSLVDPFPSRPARMHRRTYYRLFHKAIAAQERVIALDLDWLRARGLSSNETGVEN